MRSDENVEEVWLSQEHRGREISCTVPAERIGNRVSEKIYL